MNAVQPTTAALKNKSSAATSKKDANAAPPPGTSVLPISKVAKIIKADKEVRLTTKEAIFLIAKCTVRAVWITRASTRQKRYSLLSAPACRKWRWAKSSVKHSRMLDFTSARGASSMKIWVSSPSRVLSSAGLIKRATRPATTIARPEWFFLQDIIPQMIAKSDAEKQRAEHPSHVNGGTGTAGAAKAKGNVKEFTGNPVKKARRKSTTATTGAAQKAAVADDSGDAQMDVDA